MRIRVEFEVAEEIADPKDLTGLTSEGFDQLMEALMSFGDDIEIDRVDE